MPAELLQIHLLGAFAVRLGDREVPAEVWTRRKAAAIVKLLALEPGYRLHREQIIDALWPDHDRDSGANNFRNALHTARRILSADGVLHRDGGFLSLGDPGAVWVDVHAFESDLELGWRNDDPVAFQAAVDLYAGDLLPDDIYEEWLGTRRTALRTSYLTALGRLARLHEMRNNTGAAVATWQRMLLADPAAEEAHVQIMLLHARAGRRREALAQYDQLVRALEDELGAQPDPMARELARAIRAGELTGTADGYSSGETVLQSTVPLPATGIIGREREIAELQQTLSQSRLVTVLGPGGAGKTRLAIEVAGRAGAAFPGGVHFVPLAPLDNAGMVTTATLQALGIQDAAGRTPVGALAGRLANSSALLVFDNFEHVLPAATLVSTLLERCPALRVLTTSRAPLRLRGELEYVLRPLSADASAALFIERSKAVRPGFDPDRDQLPEIAGICRKLDGLPLAIELAAARSRVLSPGALLERLERPFALLNSGTRDMPARQQTLHATIAWSYDLLPPVLQTYFRRLSVFAGGWTLDGAAAVCPDGLDPLDGISALVESSLAEEHSGVGEPRFRMLETIREFAMEQLESSGETDDARRRHAGYFLTLALQVVPDLLGSLSASRQRQLGMEHDNLRVALGWALEHDPDRALHVAVELEKYWYTRGSFSEWDYWISAALERSRGANQQDRANALHQIAGAAARQGDHQRADALVEESLRIAQELDLQETLGRVKNLMSNFRLRDGDLQAARALAYESLDHYRQSGNAFAIAIEQSGIAGLECSAGNCDLAVTMIEEAVERKRAIGDAFFLSMGLGNLGRILHSCGRVNDAQQPLEEALALARSIGASDNISGVLVFQARIAVEQQRYDLARKLLMEGIEVTRGADAAFRLLNALEAAAAVLTMEGAPLVAASIFAAVEHMRETVRTPAAGQFRETFDLHREHCRSLLDPDSWVAAGERGRLLSMSEAADLALDALKALETAGADMRVTGPV